MSLITKQLGEVWDALRANHAEWDCHLEEVRIKRLRGIEDLRVPFTYPVSVLAGPNGCGKSTVLFACATAYDVPDRNARDFTPGTLFPNFKDRLQGRLSDQLDRTELAFSYLHRGERVAMVWRRGKSWNRSYMGRKGGKQPERELYLRTLANLTNPSEVRGVLQIMRKQYEAAPLTSDLLLFARRILRHRYSGVSLIRAQARDILFAEGEGRDSVRYSEFHMSSGERTILRISKGVAGLRNALVLIDEVDTGLHPYTQQQVMLELQRIALRQRLQVIVASHSPVVLDSVPPEGRKFLDRDDATNDVRLMPAHRDIFQKSLYGQSREKLSILCEDVVAEGFVLGVLDVLQPKLGLRHEDFVIGRNTGSAEFPAHVRMLGKFGKLSDFVFVLDGDARSVGPSVQKAARAYDQFVEPLYLPGKKSPEHWIWKRLRKDFKCFAKLLGQPADELKRRMREIEQTMEGAVKGRQMDKSLLEALADEVQRTAAELGRIVGRQDAEASHPAMTEFLNEMERQIDAWRRF